MDQTTTTQWPQGIGIVDHGTTKPAEANKKPRPEKEQALNCPRCHCTNTKFCYYNNYSLTQPRYFCKTCRRYWTEGGSLRNVPVGGGSRKNKRSSSSNSTNPSKKLIQSPQNPKIHDGQDLNLAYNPPNYNGIFGLNLNPQNPNLDPASNSTQIQVMEILKAGGMSSRGLGMSPFMGNTESNSVFANGFGNLHDGYIMKPSLSFSLDGIENNNNGYGNLQGVVVQDHHANSSSKNPFPFEELKQSQISTNDFQFEHQDNRSVQGSESNGYWSGMLNGGSW